MEVVSMCRKAVAEPAGLAGSGSSGSFYALWDLENMEDLRQQFWKDLPRKNR